MKKIIVTGCNGQLGRAINLELAGNPELECKYRCKRAGYYEY